MSPPIVATSVVPCVAALPPGRWGARAVRSRRRAGGMPLRAPQTITQLVVQEPRTSIITRQHATEFYGKNLMLQGADARRRSTRW